MEKQLSTRFNVGTSPLDTEALVISNVVRGGFGILHLERGQEELIITFEDPKYITSMIAHLNNIHRLMTSPKSETTAEVKEYWNTKPLKMPDRANFKTQEEAEARLSILKEHIYDHGSLTVSDYYTYVNCFPPVNSTYNFWGWDNLAFAEILLTDTGWWYIQMPTAKNLNK